MPSLTLVLIVLASVAVGAGCTVLVQLAVSLRALSRELTAASRQVTQVAASIRPTAQRIERLSRVVEESEPDVRQMQTALHKLAKSSTELTDSLARVSRWIAIGTPLAVAAVERFMHEREARAQPAGHERPTNARDPRHNAPAGTPGPARTERADPRDNAINPAEA